ncbi:putative acetyltransferase protein [Daldinia childiae]|uniref:putative acetyltransferase protein n=1 Tax=Daldinia childiae TaxID=326645 RepID=UPI001444C0FD|nr:putative acetyltransferase protein [Daldinia childiae]KAF3059405.1 putative acetyltransferase protein [Daldinia childiae]
MSGLTEWRIELISPDEEGSRFYLDYYKPFRLAALEQDPDVFGSTYNREINFSNVDWLSRINNPLVKTFVAVRLHDRKVLSATSLIGPMPNPDPASNPFQVSSEMRDGSDHHCQNHGEASSVYFQISGVYTLPEARRQGLAKILAETAIEEALAYSKQHGKRLELSLVVYTSNGDAISFYESCGFVTSAEGARKSFNPHKNASADEICMHYQKSPE